MSEPEPTQQPGAIERARARALALADAAEAARESHMSVDVGFRAFDRDRRIAAGVLAGGVAYRLFFWLLALSLIVGGALGLADAETVDDAAGQGILATLANAVGDSVRESGAAAWWLLLLGIFLLGWTGYMGAKALLLVHCAVWGVPPPRVARPWRASALFTGATVGLLVTLAVVRWFRDQSFVLGLVATVAIAIVPFVFWFGASILLPHADATWDELVPGAALFAVGTMGLNLFTTYLLGPKLSNATELYGGIGIATTMLFWLYIIGRLVTGAATLNASLHDSRRVE